MAVKNFIISEGPKIIGDLMQEGTRFRAEYAGRKLREIPEIAKFVEELGLKKPSVILGANGRGNQMVAGVVVRDGNDVVLRAAGGLDYSRGTEPIVQVRGRVGKNSARLNTIVDMNQTVDVNNAAVNISNRNGNIRAAVDTGLVKGNFKSGRNAKYLTAPTIAKAYHQFMDGLNYFIFKKSDKGIKKFSETLKGIKEPKPKMAVSKVITEAEPKSFNKEAVDFKIAKEIAKDLREKGELAKKEKELATWEKFRQVQTDEDVQFILERLGKLGKTIHDPEILTDPKIIERFGLD